MTINKRIHSIVNINQGYYNAVNELLKMVQIRCCIVREGKETELPIEQVVPGDKSFHRLISIIPRQTHVMQQQDAVK